MVRIKPSWGLCLHYYSAFKLDYFQYVCSQFYCLLYYH